MKPEYGDSKSNQMTRFCEEVLLMVLNGVVGDDRAILQKDRVTIQMTACILYMTS